MKKIDYNNYKRPSDYVRFEEGDNRVRIVSNGAMGYAHGIKTAGRWVPLGLCTEDSTCKHCKKGNQPKRFWKWIAYDFNSGETRLLDVGPMVGNAICEESSKLKKDAMEMDFIIKRIGVGRGTKYEIKVAKDEKEFDSSNVKVKKKYLINKYFKNEKDE